MPEMVELDFGLDYIADAQKAAPPRAEGYHLTSLIRASGLIARNKPVDPDDFWYFTHGPESMDEGIDEQILGMMSMGKVWEEACRAAFCQRMAVLGLVVSGPDQAELDGVWASVDGLVYQSGVSLVAIQECKFRFVHPTDPRDNHAWMAQTKGYCKVYGTLSVWMPIANLTTRPPSASSRIYAINFTQQEVDENWDMVVKTRAYLEQLRKQRGGYPR